ncbi:hypothetical protein AS850_02735 [Frondihabitans sp. 762G35]|uniref:large terminase n=1 Tax=Frondihabitans sp. 762G35 TaxID=1446794 RepID=UPI000D212DA2|nr:large terminase [Frondihabitans sp. 762G35]ARC55989.1 hypothetical protein AS850_02735 [Frondihabitans sp. 762G35]
MTVLIVPPLDLSFPTLGPELADFIEDRCIFGPGSIAGEPAKLDAEKRAALYRLYEVYPKGHRLAGRRRFQRGALEWRKGMAKTEFAAWVTFAELHPEAPVRADGFNSQGDPVGRPVSFPFIPMMAVSQEQVSDLAYGVLKYIVENGPDNGIFDSSLERIIRLSSRGIEDGKVVPVANSPGGRDGALTTFQHFDEPHRLILPRAKEAHETMTANLTKRPLDDPWSFYTSTAGQPGQGSIQEGVRREAEKIEAGEIEDPAMFFFARWAGDEHKDLETIEQRIAAISDATGPAGEYGPGQFESIAKQWDRPDADAAYLERVWLNRWRKSNSQAFDMVRWNRLAPEYLPEGDQTPEGQRPGLARPGQKIPAGAFVTGGFDGARFRDATALVITEVSTGLQELVGLWERPDDVEDWEVPEDEVTQTLEWVMKTYSVWKIYCDPPHWTETIGSWALRWPDQIEEFFTQQYGRMAYTIREYVEAMDTGSIGWNPKHVNAAEFARHMGNAGRKDLRIRDDEDKPLWVMQKQSMELKFDAAMAATLAGKACLDARKTGAKPRTRRRSVIRRLA